MVNITIDDPPEAFASFRYRCDSTFEVTQLEEMLIDRNSYGLFVIDRSEARSVSHRGNVSTSRSTSTPKSPRSTAVVVNPLNDSSD